LPDIERVTFHEKGSASGIFFLGEPQILRTVHALFVELKNGDKGLVIGDAALADLKLLEDAGVIVFKKLPETKKI
jgi:hypothetical protein